MDESSHKISVSSLSIDGVLFEYPSEFLAPSSTGIGARHVELENISVASAPWFAFWMSDQAPVKEDQNRLPTLQPQGSIAGEPRNHDFIVRFSILWPFKDGAKDSAAARSIRFAEERLAQTGQTPLQEISSWDHTLDGPISGERNYSIFYTDYNIAVQFRCFVKLGGGPAPNPICVGRAWNKSNNLIVGIEIPSSQGQHQSRPYWRRPVEYAFRLASSWRRH